MTGLNDDYQELLAVAKRIAVIGDAGGILHWDLETKMPARGLAQRAEQLALLEVLNHQTISSPKVKGLLDRIENAPGYADLEMLQKRNVHLMRKGYSEEAALPERLVEELAKQAAITTDTWKRAKAAKDFSIFRPELERMFELRKESAAILREVKGARTDYDALLDVYEPGMTADRIAGVFGEMRDGLMALIEKVEGSEMKADLSIMTRPVPIEVQRRVSEAAMDFIGFQTKGPDAHGRLDETEHPFSIGYYNDVRITTHYYEDRFVSNLFSVLHEGGHAIYEGDLPAEWIYQPIGHPCSFGIHESQSRFVENMVGRSPQFLAYILPRLQEMTGNALGGVGIDDFILSVNAVVPSRIRIEADEVTYGLHIIIRFELEKDIMAGRLEVGELPHAWNEKYSEYLGMDIRNDSEGVMQDTHWSGGSLGYFPSYALGNLYGGMFLNKMEKDVPEWRSEVGRGNFRPVRTWLSENVHSKGALYDPADLVKVVTGSSVEVGPFLHYLGDKLSAIYGF